MQENKLKLCILPTQMGKTFITIKSILEEINENPSKGRSVHIVFTMNTLLNNKQFSNRLEEINNKYGDKSVCVFSSKYDGNLFHIKSLKGLINFSNKNDNLPHIIVACSNTRRFIDCFNYIEYIEKENTLYKRCFVYFDELHKYITNKKYNLRSNIEHINNFNIVSGIIAMSATPDTIWCSNGFWSNIKIIKLCEYNDENYAGVDDIIFECMENTPLTNIEDYTYDENYNVNYIDAILKKHPNILDNNTRTFIPAFKKIKTHTYVRNLIFEYNKKCIIITLNGVDKSIRYYDTDTDNCITIPLVFNSGELGDTIGEYLEEFNLLERPIVFTGFLCVGMGQTLVSEKLGSFTSAIFGYNNIKNDNMYQLFGRITGRIKHWGDKYVKPTVYCTSFCKNICELMEKCAKNILLKHNGELLNNDIYREPINKDNSIINNFFVKSTEYYEFPKHFNNMDDVKATLHEIFKVEVEIREFIIIDDYYISKNLKLWYKKKIRELISDDRLLIETYNKIPIRLNLSKIKKHSFMIYPVYSDEKSIDVKYYIRYCL